MPLQSTHTTAQGFLESPQVNEAVETLVRELRAASATITQAQPPQQELVQTLEQTLERVAAARGRGLLYPYIGSGIGNGPLVELIDGSVKWDMISGIGVFMFGHSDPEIVEVAVRAALSDVSMQGNLQCNADAVAFAELLVKEAASSSRLAHCFLTNSGAMANESALKVCMQKNAPASRVLAFAGSFAGRSTAMAQVTDNPAARSGLPPGLVVDYVPFYDPLQAQASIDHTLQRLREHLDRHPGHYACFSMELVQGEGGFNTAPREFFVAVMELLKERGVAIWADEIQSFGRTLSMYHFDQLGLGQYIDVVTIGKMSQVCACLFTEDYNPRPGLLSGTFIGSTASLQIGRRMLQRMLDGGYYGPDGRNAKLFEAFGSQVKSLVQKHPDWFPPLPGHQAGDASQFYGGVGGMTRFSPFGGEKAVIQKLLHHLFEEGVIAFYCGRGPFHIRFLSPVGVMKPEQFADVFEIVEAAMARTAAEM